MISMRLRADGAALDDDTNIRFARLHAHSLGEFDERAPTCDDVLLNRSFVNTFFSFFVRTFTVSGKERSAAGYARLALTINIKLG